MAMRGLLVRALVAAGAAVALLIPAAAASAAGPPVLGWTPGTGGVYDYGAVQPGSAVSQTFTLRNSGGSASAALTVTVTGSAFTKTADSCTGTSLGPGKSCTVTVSYSPAAAGQADTATLTATGVKSAATASLTLRGAGAKATPAITTSQQPASATAGSKVADQATVTGGSSPAGTVTFTLYDNSGCTGTPLFTDTETLADGTATSGSYPAAAGTDYWTAAYNGNTANNAVTSGCADEPVTITPATPAITTSQQPASATAGSSIMDQATVTGGSSPTGTVTFFLFSRANCNGNTLLVDTEPLVNGTATTVAYPTLPYPSAVGTDYWVAAYNGDANNNPVVSGCNDEPVTITPVPDLVLSPGTSAGTVNGQKLYDYTFPVLTGSSETTQFTITNIGSATSQTLALVPDDFPGFSTTNDLCSGQALAPGKSCTFDATFSTAGCANPDNGPLAVGGTGGANYIILAETGGDCT